MIAPLACDLVALNQKIWLKLGAAMAAVKNVPFRLHEIVLNSQNRRSDKHPAGASWGSSTLNARVGESTRGSVLARQNPGSVDRHAVGSIVRRLRTQIKKTRNSDGGGDEFTFKVLLKVHLLKSSLASWSNQLKEY